MKYYELHTHLYGSISPETLYEIGKNNSSPRWKVYTDLYYKLYNKEFNTENFFEEYSDIQKFKELYLFNKKARFLEFQCKFNLIIALTRFADEEIRYIAEKVVSEHSLLGIQYAEYRLMYSPGSPKNIYYSKTKAACEGLKAGELKAGNLKARLVVSLYRSAGYEEAYGWLKEFKKSDPIINEYLVGIDFCYIEEGFPPKEKKKFFEKVINDNKNESDCSFSILYHVGESFNDKSLKSATRWVLESALNGAHRLGHCIALGINPEIYINKLLTESIEERIDQINFELENYDEISGFGKISEKKLLIKELENLTAKEPLAIMEIKINSSYINEAFIFQEYAMDKIRTLGTVVECCPTSNLLIGMLDSIKMHPIYRFKEKGLNIVVGSDDPGIFGISLPGEFELLIKNGLSKDDADKLRISAFQFTSENLVKIKK